MRMARLCVLIASVALQICTFNLFIIKRQSCVTLFIKVSTWPPIMRSGANVIRKLRSLFRTILV